MMALKPNTYDGLLFVTAFEKGWTARLQSAARMGFSEPFFRFLQPGRSYNWTTGIWETFRC
jgi:hypothetical protein